MPASFSRQLGRAMEAQMLEPAAQRRQRRAGLVAAIEDAVDRDLGIGRAGLLDDAP